MSNITGPAESPTFFNRDDSNKFEFSFKFGICPFLPWSRKMLQLESRGVIFLAFKFGVFVFRRFCPPAFLSFGVFDPKSFKRD